jgi:hypothetical protein
MALFSLFVKCESVGTFGTQIDAVTPRASVSEFLKGDAIYEFLAGRGKRLPKKLKEVPDPGERFSDKDIVLFVPMDGLVNMHLCQLGRGNQHITIITVLTQRS